MAFSLGRGDPGRHARAPGLPPTGLHPPKASAERAHDILAGLVPDELKTPMHVGLIRLGREICKPGAAQVRGLPLERPVSDGALGPGRHPRHGTAPDVSVRGGGPTEGGSERGESNPRLKLGKLAFCH